MAIKSRIQLRHDLLSAWENSSSILYAGEVAFGQHEDGSFEMRVGDGEHTWNELTASPIMWNASQIIGLEDAISQLSTQYFQVSSLNELTGSYSNGDVAVVVKSMGENSQGQAISSYTAYIYGSDVSAWKAMDGNYNADNVYFDYNIVKAGAWGGVGNVTHTPNTVEQLDSTGKSLTEVMDMIFKGEEAFPKKASNNKPTCGVTQTSQSVEVGTTVTPKFTMSFDKKTYAYGSNTNTNLASTTGVSAISYTLTYTDKAGQKKTLTGNWATSRTADESFEVSAGTNCSGAQISVDYGAAGEGLYIPRSNLERVLSSQSELQEYKLQGGRCTASNNVNSIIGYYPNYYGFVLTPKDLDNLVYTDLTSLTKETSSPNSSTGKINPRSSATANSTWKQFFYALPAGMKNSAQAIDSNKLPCTVKKTSYVVTIPHQGNVSSDYDVFYIDNANEYGATTLALTWN